MNEALLLARRRYQPASNPRHALFYPITPVVCSYACCPWLLSLPPLVFSWVQHLDARRYPIDGSHLLIDYKGTIVDEGDTIRVS